MKTSSTPREDWISIFLSQVSRLPQHLCRWYYFRKSAASLLAEMETSRLYKFNLYPSLLSFVSLINESRILQAVGKQLRLFAEEEIYRNYRYPAYVTNLKFAPAEIWRLYEERGDAIEVNICSLPEWSFRRPLLPACSNTRNPSHPTRFHHHPFPKSFLHTINRLVQLYHFLGIFKQINLIIPGN